MEETSIRQYIYLYSLDDKSAEGFLDLSDRDLTGCDLSHLDLRRVNFSKAKLANANVEGAWLQGAVITKATFEGIPVDSLLKAGLSPRVILAQRAETNRRMYPALNFSSSVSSVAPLLLTVAESRLVCQKLQGLAWEQIEDKTVFALLYPGEEYGDWIRRCRHRRVLDWALAHREYLNRYVTDIPGYRRVLPVALLDEIEESDLVAGMRTNPERLFHTVGLRCILKQSDLKGKDIEYPAAPFGNGEGIVQIRSRYGLQMEGGLMHHCVATYDEACLSERCYIYHVGPAAPEGSTLEVFPDGQPGQHRASYNRMPDVEDREKLGKWLVTLGLEDITKTPLMERVCERLRRRSIAQVYFQIYWYEDETGIYDVKATDKAGQEMVIVNVGDEELWTIVRDIHGNSEDGQWLLQVEEEKLVALGDPIYPIEDEEREMEYSFGEDDDDEQYRPEYAFYEEEE